MKRSFFIVCLVIAVVTWLAYFLLAHPVAGRIASKWGPQIVRAGDGKFADPVVFLERRFFEAAWLTTVAMGLAVAAVYLGKFAARRLPRLWQWITYAVTGFLGLNVWLHCATATCLFWCLFWNGKGATDNLTQFQIKLLLMDENPAPVKIVLAGSSQVFAQIDHRLLNRELGTNAFSAPLYFPGNHGSDFVFLNRQLKRHRADIIVAYLSEMNFFEKGLSEGYSLFFTWRDLPRFLNWGGQAQWSPRIFGYGLLSDTLPLFGLRDPFAQRSLGSRIAQLRQNEYVASLASDLHARAIEAAPRYAKGPQSRFEMRAFETFVAQCFSRQQTVVLCCGQLNPLLEEQIDPALRPQFLGYLHQLAATYKNVILLEARDLPVQAAADYQDLTHVNSAAQSRFTEMIAQVLQRLIATRRG